MKAWVYSANIIAVLDNSRVVVAAFVNMGVMEVPSVGGTAGYSTSQTTQTVRDESRSDKTAFSVGVVCRYCTAGTIL